MGHFLEEVTYFMNRFYLTSVHLSRARTQCSLPVSFVPWISSPSSTLFAINCEQTGVNLGALPSFPELTHWWAGGWFVFRTVRLDIEGRTVNFSSSIISPLGSHSPGHCERGQGGTSFLRASRPPVRTSVPWRRGWHRLRKQ